MLTQPKKAPAPLALRAPEIPGRTEQDLPSGEWGLNFAAVQGNFPDKGLKVHILDWTQMSISDNVKLLLDGGEVDQHTITQQTEVGERVTLWVPPNRFLTGPYELTYTVKRPSQSDEPYTPPVKLYVKLELPGGQDLDPDPGSHSELYMYIDPALVEDGVDQDAAENGVDIIVRAKPDSSTPEPYPNIAVGDLITLSWGGVLVESDPVEQAQVDDPDNNPITLHVSKEVILEAGDSGSDGLAVTFQIHDLVKNQSEDWCPETRIVVDTGSSRLEAPIVHQADGNVLDLDTLGDAAVMLEVWAVDPDIFAKDDVIIMRVKGTTLDGDPIESTARKTLGKNPPDVVEVLLPNSAARALARTQAVFSYKLERGGTVIGQSKGRFINIIGEPTQLEAPIADDAQSGALDPDLTSTRIRIPFDEVITAEMAIELKWAGTRADQSSYEPEFKWIHPSVEEVENKEDFFFTVDGPHLKTLEGGTLDLSYNLLSVDEDDNIISRGSRHAALLNVGEPRFELAPPIVLGEQDGALEPEDLPNGTSKVTCPNPVTNPTKRGDVVHWELRDAQGVLLDEDSKPLNALSEGKPVEFPLSAAFVQEHFEAHRGGELKVKYDILRFATGKYSYSDSLKFVIGTALALQPPSVKEANGGTLNPVNAKDSLTIEVPANDGLLPDDKLKVTWAGAPDDGSYTSDESLVGDGLGIEIPNSVVAFNLGNSVTVSYEVIRGNQDPIPSSDLTLVVQPIAQDDLLVAKPKILQADNSGEGAGLDLGTVTSGGTIRVGVWPLIAAGQYVWLRLKGRKADGTAHDLTLAPGSRVSQGWVDQGYALSTAPYSYLQDLGNDTQLDLEFKVTLDRSQDEAEAVTLPLRSYSIRVALDLPAPRVIEADADDTVDPSVLPGGVTIRVEFDDMRPGDDVTMIFEGTADGSARQSKRVGTPPAPLDYTVGQGTLLPNSDRFALVFYEVHRNGLPLGDPSAQYSLRVLGLEWNAFSINGWNPSVFQPTTGFDGAYYTRSVGRAVGPVTYTSSRPEVTVNAAGQVTLVRAWTGAATITARDGAGRSVAYTLNAPAKWFLTETLARRSVAQLYAYVQANAGKGYRPPIVADFTVVQGQQGDRRLGHLYPEWGSLIRYGWGDGGDAHIWLANDPGGTTRWRDLSFLDQGRHLSGQYDGTQVWWTICYRNKP
ncbi:Ig-like domain-containing protein [Pseudomonas sp. SWRI154]|uniref:Ig-like domain-containing protein n=1 Tax=Pseudomonas sp. SWRI154 TaxID=2745501 RepID=UPI001644D767|nr:Ig-like domain-containing protein [Pseudomonas sp. SWRI154]MBC3362757.1 Ig-like domain-containing protein [Pseudomonas sp. SWRI154]